MIVINSSETKDNTNIIYGINSTKIFPLEKKDFTRFLGVWIGETDNKHFVNKQIKDEIDRAYNIMKYKKIIDDQVRYIYNVVLVPRCEYKMMITILSRGDINMLTTKIRRLMRNKIGISNTVPNIILTHREFYNLIDLYYRQGESQIVNLLKRLNNKNLIGKITEIRIKQLQEQEFLHDNPMEIWNYSRINLFKNNIIAKILCITKELGLNISPIGIENKYNFKKIQGEQHLQTIFKEDFRRYKDQLKKKQIYTLDQIASSDGSKLLEWKQLPSKNNITLRGKIPGWFRELEKITMLDSSRTFKNEYKISNNKYKSRNQRILLSTKIDHRHSIWCAGLPEKNSKNIYIGLLHTKKPLIYTESMIDIIHYKLLDNTSVNKSSSLHLTKCTGCYTGTNRNGHCVISIEKKYSIIIKSKVTDKENEDKKKMKVIDQMITDLIMDIKNLIKEHEISSNTVHIEVNKVDDRDNLIENILGYK